MPTSAFVYIMRWVLGIFKARKFK